MSFKDIIEICFSSALFVNALLFIPQAIRLWKTKSPEGVSLLTFGGFTLIQLLAVLHGYLKQDYILLIGFGLSFITCGVITSLLIFYKICNYRFRIKK